MRRLLPFFLVSLTLVFFFNNCGGGEFLAESDTADLMSSTPQLTGDSTTGDQQGNPLTPDGQPFQSLTCTEPPVIHMMSNWRIRFLELSFKTAPRIWKLDSSTNERSHIVLGTQSGSTRDSQMYGFKPLAIEVDSTGKPWALGSEMPLFFLYNRDCYSKFFLWEGVNPTSNAHYENYQHLTFPASPSESDGLFIPVANHTSGSPLTLMNDNPILALSLVPRPDDPEAGQNCPQGSVRGTASHKVFQLSSVNNSLTTLWESSENLTRMDITTTNENLYLLSSNNDNQLFGTLDDSMAINSSGYNQVLPGYIKSSQGDLYFSGRGQLNSENYVLAWKNNEIVGSYQLETDSSWLGVSIEAGNRYALFSSKSPDDQQTTYFYVQNEMEKTPLNVDPNQRCRNLNIQAFNGDVYVSGICTEPLPDVSGQSMYHHNIWINGELSDLSFSLDSFTGIESNSQFKVGCTTSQGYRTKLD